MVTEIQGLDVAARAKCSLGEGPAWNHELNALHFVDIFGKKVFTYFPETNSVSSFDTVLSPGAVIPTDSSKLLIAMNDGIYFSNYDGKELNREISIEPEIENNRMNDAKCDPKGRLFAGTMGDGNSPTGSLYKISPKQIEKVLGDVTVSNGLAWTENGTKLYYIDSGRQSVLVARYDLEKSQPSHFETFIEFPESFGIPDGMCSDAEDGIWVAFFNGSCIRRFSSSGKLTHVIKLPVSQVTSCCFHGRESSIMYISTASLKLNPEQVNADIAGSIFSIDTGIVGTSTISYKS